MTVALTPREGLGSHPGLSGHPRPDERVATVS